MISATSKILFKILTIFYTNCRNHRTYFEFTPTDMHRSLVCLNTQLSSRAGLLVRAYATEAKTAVKKKGADQEADMPALQPFVPKMPSTPNIPDVTGVDPKDLGIRWKKEWQAPHHTLMRGIDVTLREQYDQQNRWLTFDKEMKLGSIVMVESVSSRTIPKRQVVTGVVVKKEYCGIASHYTITSLMNGTLVTVQMPLFSPNVLKIKILGSFSEEELFANGLLRDGSLAKIYNSHEARLYELADSIKQRAAQMKEDRANGKKNPSRSVQEAILKSQYVKEAKQLMKRLRFEIKSYKRGPEANRKWSGWSEIDEMRQRAA